MPSTIDDRIDLSRYRAAVRATALLRGRGRVTHIIGLVLEIDGVTAQIGELCYVTREGAPPLPAEVVGFRDQRTLLMPLGEMHRVHPGAAVEATGSLLSIPSGEALLGRVIDGLGRPIDRKGPIRTEHIPLITESAPDPLTRQTITEPLSTGVRAIDGVLTCGRGQRIGIFAGSGIGKSTLLGMIARHASADFNVIALIGERGREVREFIERDLGEDGLKRSVVVVSTSDQPALVRLKAAWTATTIAEHFRSRGADVTLLMDSITRFAMAQREIGLAAGEPPAVKGYTPSVFALLPKLLERAGTSEHGAITGFYTVLVESDDMTEPVTDTVRGTLDGHIVLTRALAAENHYPPIDVLASISRVMPSVTTTEHRRAAGKLRETLATYQNSRDLITIGAYQMGSSPQVDYAIQALPHIQAYLRQEPGEACGLTEAVSRLRGMFEAPAFDAATYIEDKPPALVEAMDTIGRIDRPAGGVA